ncbi:MAG: PH domain-containing protein [Acidobacteria bacterium]|nr:PH domain-containing protein [Acidobacteriota bacterium]
MESLDIKENAEFAENTETSHWRPLDPRVVPLWRLGYLIGLCVVLLMLLPFATMMWLRGGVYSYLYPVAWLALAACALWFCRWRPNRVYRAWAYRIDGRVLETRSGVWFRLVRLLPLNRLQHVDLQRGPLERMFGLASLVLYTAGTSSASITVPGLDHEEAARLRDHLIAIGGDDAV